MRKTWSLCRAPANGVAFALRRRGLTVGGRPALLPSGTEGDLSLFGYLQGSERRDAEAVERDLRRRYRLDTLRGQSAVRDYRDVLDLLAVLDGAAAELRCDGHATGERALRLLDVGAQTWRYVPALERWMRARCASDATDSLVLTGVEIDGNARLRDGSSWANHGAAYARRASQDGSPVSVCSYLSTDVRRWQGPPQDVVTLLFPFLSRYPLLDWGLPLSLFDPKGIVDHSARALRPGGTLVSLHQTADELAEMLRIVDCAAPSLHCVATWSHRSQLVGYWPKTQGRQVAVFRSR